MKTQPVCLTVVFVLLLINLTPIVESQAPIPDIDLDCAPSTNVEVWPGSIGGGSYYCIVTNNSIYTSEVEIEITSDLLVATGPNSISVGPGEEVTFQIALRGEIGMPTGTTMVNVEATVVEMNGLPPVTAEQQDSDTIVSILQYGRVEVQATESVINGYAGSDMSIEFEVTNTGNGVDTLRASIFNIDLFDYSGFVVVINPDSKQAESGETVSFTVEVTLPSKDSSRDEFGDMWEKDESGEYYIAYFMLDFAVTSELECRNGACYTESASVIIEVEDSIESGGVLGMSSTTTYLLGGGTVSLGIFLVALFYVKRQPKQNLTEQISNDNTKYVEPTQEEDEIKDEFDFL